MECNRDEAVRAREIAELKYGKQDFAGAKKFLLKAQQLFPGLEGLSQMMAVMDVHAVAQIKIGGTEMDWYGILQVEPAADDGTIKKQYRRLALLLHPDKNKAVGAEAAFKLIGEAWGILSDKAKRNVHDVRRGVKGKVNHVRVAVDSNVQHYQSPSSAAAAPTAATAQAAAAATGIHNPPPPGSTFWTSCPRCKMQYQYLRTYENYQLQCHKCKEVFLARDIHSNSGNGGYGWSSFGPDPAHQRHQDIHMKTGAPFNGAAATNGFVDPGSGPFAGFNKMPTAPFYSTAAAQAAAQSKVAAAAAAAAAAASSTVPTNNLAADVVQQTYQKVKRERVEAEKEIKRKEKELRKKERDEQRKEKDELRKSRDAERAREAMDRLMAKRKENVIKEETKRKVDMRPTKKLKRKKRASDAEEEEEDLEDEDSRLSDQMLDDQFSPLMGRRRSGRTKKNVATYKVDMSDDSDIEAFPASKRTKMDADGESDGPAVKLQDNTGRESNAQQMHTENGARVEKGKTLAGDSNNEKLGSDLNGAEEIEQKCQKPGSGAAKQRMESMKDGQYGVSKMDDSRTSRRSEGDSKDSRANERGTPNSKSRKAESLSKEKDMVNLTNDEADKILKSDDEISLSKSRRTLRMRGKPTEKEDKGEESKVDFRAHQQPTRPTPIPRSPEVEVEEEEEDQEDEEEEEEEEEKHPIFVPDPDFHDFDALRTESDILVGQIWALYDDQDGMPRFYGRVSRTATSPSFKVHISWLELSDPSEESQAWMDRTGLSITCGEFKLGKPTAIDQINIFSHKLVQKTFKSIVKIFPRKGEVWAIYRDWNPDDLSGPDPVPRLQGQEGSTYRYEMVEILSDYTEDRGVRTVKLVKVAGFKTLFQRHAGQATRICRPSELPIFSHSVPVERMEGEESIGVPPNCLELDPASTPMELIVGTSDESR